MKKTYKLLSIYLDHQPLPSTSPLLLTNLALNNISNLNVKYNLFDSIHCTRKITATQLLSYQNFKSIDNILQTIPECEQLLIILDTIWPSNDMNELFVKRTLQVFNYIQTNHASLKLNLVCKTKFKDLIQTIINKLYVTKNKSE